MSFFNDAQRDGLLTGRYICSECGGLMEFEDEWEDTLVCPACGHSVDLEHYGKKLSIMQCMPPFQNGKRYPHLFLTTW